MRLSSARVTPRSRSARGPLPFDVSLAFPFVASLVFPFVKRLMLPFVVSLSNHERVQ